MTSTGRAAAVFALTFAGLPGVILAGACSSFTAVTPGVDAAPEPALLDASPCGDASFCDDFEDPQRDAGWLVTIDDAPEPDGGPVAAIFIGPEGRGSAKALHVEGFAVGATGFRTARWAQVLATGAQSAELSFSIRVAQPTFAPDAGKAQLALLNLPGALLYPVLTRSGLAFAYTTKDGAYLEPDSTVSFGYGVWHTMTLAIDLDAGRVRATIDGSEALAADFTPNGNAGTYIAAVGLRTESGASALDIRYDDVVVRLH